MKKFMILLVLCILSTAVVSAANQQKGNSTSNVERVEKKNTNDPKQDANPIVGTLTRKNGQTYDIHRGPRGGEYYWRIASKGKHQGEWVKAYPTKEEKAQIKYKK